MDNVHLDRVARSLNSGGSRRKVLKAIVAGAVGVGILARGPRSSAAQEADMFQQCMAGCLAPCSAEPVCPTWEACAASCSQALW